MNDIEQIPVSSSNVTAIGYREDTQTLRIWFTVGTIYDYFNVPLMEFEGLRNAPSIGSYIARSIKGIYPYQKVG